MGIPFQVVDVVSHRNAQGPDLTGAIAADAISGGKDSLRLYKAGRDLCSSEVQQVSNCAITVSLVVGQREALPEAGPRHITRILGCA